MPIEVIKQGVPPEERRVQGTCTNCKSELRWKASDGVHGADQRDGDYNMVLCPVCKSKVFGGYA